MSTANRPGESTLRVILPEAVDWQPFVGFPATARLGVLVGDPARPGPYVVRVFVPRGERMMPHKFSQERIYTVISGIFYIALGEQFDETQLTAYGPGSVVIVPGDLMRFNYAKSDDFIVQVNGMGPLVLTYLKRGDDPRIK